MKRYPALIAGVAALAFAVLLICSGDSISAELFKARDGSGIVGYKDTPILPWCNFRQHDPDRPAPRRVTPPEPSSDEKTGSAPSDAVVLFDGSDLSQWLASDWKVENGRLIAVSGSLTTTRAFGDCQLHIEWMAPDPPQGSLWDHGNNGVMLMGLFEIQIYDSYTTKIYPDGQAASVYGQTPPMVDACRRPGQWQTFDIVFYAPVFKNDALEKPAFVTVLHNGLLVHHNQKIYGPTGHRVMPEYKEAIPRKLPLSLSAHNNPVSFRNIWIRPL